MHPDDRTLAARMLRSAALSALRAAGLVEPNPLVGCVITGPDGALLGRGHHRRSGGPHAEAEALADCERRGNSPRGATVFVTLEPCNHHGKTPPCTEALIRAGVARVIAARPDPNPDAAGGADRLRSAGIPVEFTDACPLAARLADPFVRRIETGLPWVTIKWAQTIDGRIATRTGDSKWISCEASRLRARADAVLTGIGTVLADNPLLTARGVRRRRTARRIVVDPGLRIPERSALLGSLDAAPLTVACAPFTRDEALRAKAARLRARGVEVVELPPDPEARPGLSMEALLRHLATAHNTATVLVEAGPRLVGSLMQADLADELLVFVAPAALADAAALPPASGAEAPTMRHARRFTLLRAHALAGDAVLLYRRA
jgi:diaminohydroxyphosphoribosylaminopyrimidine deaminase/5-amino-6-(5-phosphoribosylamino)uracil reductase